MVNKYLNKIKKDFENAKWDARIKNYDDSPFPQVLSDKLAIAPPKTGLRLSFSLTDTRQTR
ncbi:hypothetical protein VA249_07430 [Vibrio alfacsensis]|nr:hypothetical protein VA249_07430 [Vibrio alfacsensis]